MTKVEWAKVHAYVASGTGAELPKESMAVYFDCLGDLPFDVAMAAAKRVLVAHRYPTFPSIAEFREAAAETASGEAAPLSPAEAWALAWKAVGATDPEVDGSFARAVARFRLPPLVVEAVKAFGLPAMCHGGEPVGVVRGQFLKIFEQLAAREKRLALLPPDVRRQIDAAAARAALPAPPEPVRTALAGIGAAK